MTTARYRPPQRPASLVPALSRLKSLAPLRPEDEERVRALQDWRADPPGAQLDRGEPAPVRLLTSGWAARLRWLPNGKRQIFNFVLTGDLTGVDGPAEYGAVVTVALSPVQSVDAAPLMDHPGSPPASPLAVALARSRALETASVFDQVVRLGRMAAFERVGHLILGLHRRVVSCGQTSEGRIEFPLTQEVLADATGLSIVHVNRVIQRLRTERLADFRNGHLIILEPDLLSARVGLDPVLLP